MLTLTEHMQLTPACSCLGLFIIFLLARNLYASTLFMFAIDPLQAALVSEWLVIGPKSVLSPRINFCCVFSCLLRGEASRPLSYLTMLLTLNLFNLLWINRGSEQFTMTVWQVTLAYLTNWYFITEGAPWQGGMCEPLVRLIKQCSRKSIGSICLTYIQLQTIVTEVEAVINCRPLTYVGSDFASGHLTTPAHFLTLDVKTVMPHVDYDVECLGKNSLKGRLIQIWKRGMQHLNNFWKLWRNQYLLSLRERAQHSLKQAKCSALKRSSMGGVVLVCNQGPRGSCKLGRIIGLPTGSRGEIRAAKIAISSGTITHSAMMHLYPLECDEPKGDADCTGSAENYHFGEISPSMAEDALCTLRIQNTDSQGETVQGQ